MATTKVSPDLLDLDAGITISVADNSDNLTLVSTDTDAGVGPNLNLYRNSGSPADSDVLGVITFNGRNDNSQDVMYARQLSYITDASDGTEDGTFKLQSMVGGTIRDRLNITPSEINLNEDSIDTDFRVESGSNTHMLFVDGGNDRVGIGTASPIHELHVASAHPVIALQDTDSTEPLNTYIDFLDSGDNSHGYVGYGSSSSDLLQIANRYDDIVMYTGSSGSVSERMRIDSSGNVGISIDPENTYTSYTALEISRSGSIYANNAADDLNIGTNFYLESGGNWRAKNTETASLLQFDNGAVNIYTAASTTADNNISWNHKISFPNLGGIAFNGDTAQANALDDYEEGTWTPTSGVSLTTTTACRYVKVGTQVTITFDITFASSTSGSQPIIGNLPFSLTTYNGGYPNWQNTGSGVMIHCAGTQGNLYNSVTNAAFTYQAVAGKRVIGTIVGIVA